MKPGECPLPRFLCAASGVHDAYGLMVMLLEI